MHFAIHYIICVNAVWSLYADTLAAKYCGLNRSEYAIILGQIILGFALQGLQTVMK